MVLLPPTLQCLALIAVLSSMSDSMPITDFPAGSDFADDLSVVSSPTEAPESQDIGVDPPEDLDNQVIIEDEIWQYRYPPFFDPPSAQSLTAVGTTEEDEDEFASEEDPVVQVSTAAPVPFRVLQLVDLPSYVLGIWDPFDAVVKDRQVRARRLPAEDDEWIWQG